MTPSVKLAKLGPFEFNPRGNLWYNDESTFGHKLLSKMGWSKGKGLGKNEDGIKENIKVGKKDNLSGVGYKHDFNIAVGCLEYENILANLQKKFNNKGAKAEETDDAKELESLEKRSQNSRSRVHYQKFIRGKDLFSRSEKDMKCIFLDNKTLAEDNSEKEVVKELPIVKSELSINDYFAMKMKQKLAGSAACTAADDNPRKKRKNAFESDLGNKRMKIKNEEISSDYENYAERNKKGVGTLHTSKKPKLENGEALNSLSVKNFKRKKKHKQTSKIEMEHAESCDYLITSTSDETVGQFNNEDGNSISHKNKNKVTHEDKHILNIKTSLGYSPNLTENRTTNSDFETGESNSHTFKSKSKAVHGDSSKLENENLLNETNNSTVKIISKKKSKKKRLNKLKSCIKSRSASYDLNSNRKVSFSEKVFYKLMDTSFESVDPINDSVVGEVEDSLNENDKPEDKELEEGECSSEEGEPANVESDVPSPNENNVLGETDAILAAECAPEINNEEMDVLPACFDLPKNPASNFNMWLDSQKSALKTGMYRDMIKKIKKHKVLGTTNLLDIKGYANWRK